jgi:hypothetical protein
MDQYDASNIADNPPKDMVDESKMGIKYQDVDLFPADRIISQMSKNMAIAESRVDDKPLWTEKTAEIAAKEQESNRK